MQSCSNIHCSNIHCSKIHKKIKSHEFEITNLQLKEAYQKTHDPTDPDSNNGLITKIWGPPAWEFFHSIQFGYPINPTPQDKAEYKAFFTVLGNVLPCCFCKDSYGKFITEDVVLDDEALKSRESLTRWGHRLHNRVNQKLGIDYGVTYEELCYKYQSYRAKCTKTDKGCVMPLSLKSKSYQNADIRRAPIVDYAICYKLIPHSKTMGLPNYEAILEKTSKLKRNSKEWMRRDNICTKIIKYMRRNGISCLDDEGLPSMHEMMLLSMMSTNIEHNKLIEIASTIR